MPKTSKPSPAPSPETKPITGAPLTIPSAKVVKSNSSHGWPWWLWVIVGVVVVGGAAGLGWFFFGRTAPATTNTPTGNTNTTTTLPRVLDGVQVPADQANPTILAAMIENLVGSRPPSGLDKASVVYEALAEGGITRFLALFPSDAKITEIGPIRSARPYYISWAEEYKAVYLHAGGSPQALAYLKSGKANLIDFNQFVHAPNFYRDRTRFAPHNLYTSSFLMSDGLNRLKLPAPTYTSWTFGTPTPLDQRPVQTNDIVVDFSSFNYKVKYTYDRVNNRYVRFLADKPHVTRDGSAITADNVVVEFMTVGLLPGEKERLDLKTIGTGQLIVFRNGTTVPGTWKKDNNSGRTQFLDQQGNAIALNPGVTWIEAVPVGRKVTS